MGEVSVADLAQLLREIAGPEAEEAVMTTAERLKQEGRQEGRQEEKLLRSQEILFRQLRIKFGRDLPEAIEQRVASATLADLDAWLERVLSAATLGEVFAPAE